MALTRREIYLNAYTDENENKLIEKPTQGSNDTDLLITLMQDSKPIALDGSEEVQAIVIYNYDRSRLDMEQISHVINSSDPDYVVPTVSNGNVKIALTETITAAWGHNMLIIKVTTSSKDVVIFTRHILFETVENKAYSPISIIDNLPSYKGLEAEVNALKQTTASNTAKIDTATNKNNQQDVTLGDHSTRIGDLETLTGRHTTDIIKNKNDIATKANSDMSNVGEFTSADDGDMFYKKGGRFAKAPLKIDDTLRKITTPYDIKIPPNSLELGLNTKLHEEGGFLGFTTETLGKDYLLLDYENDPVTGTKKPIYYQRGAREINFKDQAVNSTRMDNVQFINYGQVPFDRQVSKVYFDFATAVTNFKIMLNVNGKDVADYPTGSWYEPTTQGYSLGTGIQSIDLRPYWSELTEYTIIVKMKADAPISLMGNGTIPYLAFDLNRITRKDIALMDDVTSGGATTFKQLTDTPDAIVPNQIVVGNSDGSKLEFIPIPTGADTSNLAGKDLANVNDDVFKNKSVASGMLQQDLEDVDLQKLGEKGVAAKLADNKLGNVAEDDIDTKFRQTPTYRIIYDRLPQFRGVRANTIEEQQALTADQFDIPDQIIHIQYQITTQNEFIEQRLPSSAINKVLIIEVIYSDGVTVGGVKITPYDGDYFNGATTSYAINKKGIAGIAFAGVNSWDWIPYTSPKSGINVNDQKSNFFVDTESMAFGDGFTTTQDPDDSTKVKIDYDGEAELTFVDTETGIPFTAKKLKSLDKGIKLSQIDSDTADISMLGVSDNVGVFAKLNENLLLNSKFSAHSKLHFVEDPETKNYYVYGTNNKGFVVQDVNPQDDPNISGGSQFICIFDLVPSKDSGNIISQDGSIALQLLDKNGNIIQDEQNKDLGVQIDYKAGQPFKEEILALIFTVKPYTEVFPNIIMNFPNEEIIGLSADTSITLQAFSNDFFKGRAIKAFEDYSGHHIDGYTRYYGYNSINLAQYLSYDTPLQDMQPTSFEYANHLYFSCKTPIRFGIQQGKMLVKDDGTNFPVFSIAKVYDSLDCEYIGDKTEKITVKLENNNTAYDVSLFRYTGSEIDSPRPELLRFDGTTPVFTDGWTMVETMPMDANIEAGEHTYTKEFLMPNNAKQLAIILYPRTDNIPKELYLVDMEGDFVPWFNRFILTNLISSSEYARMYDKKHYFTLVNLPKGISEYRFTAGNTDTKVPIGVVFGSGGKIINNHAWTDTGAYDPNKVQGDYEFADAGKIVDFSYIIPCYNEGNSESEVHFWLAKVNADGTFTEIPNSRADTTIPANRTKSPLMVTCVGELDDKNKPTNKFSFSVSKGESVRVFMKSDKEDGFFIKCGDGIPFLYKSLMDFEEVTETDKEIERMKKYMNEIEFVENGVPVPDQSKYQMKIDVKTGQSDIKEVK